MTETHDRRDGLRSAELLILSSTGVVVELGSLRNNGRPLQQAAVRPGVAFKTAAARGFPEADGPQYRPRKAGLLILRGTGIVVELESVQEVCPRLKLSRGIRRGG